MTFRIAWDNINDPESTLTTDLVLDSGEWSDTEISKPRGRAVRSTSSSGYIQWDTLGDTTFNTFILQPPTEEWLQCYETATFTLKGSTFLDDWDNPVFEHQLTVTPEGVYGYYNDDFQVPYYRLEYESNNPQTVELNLGYIFLGDSFSVARGNLTKGFSISPITETDVYRSDGGQTYSYEKTASNTIKNTGVRALEYEDLRLLRELVHILQRSRNFCLVMDPEEAVSQGFDLTFLCRWDRMPTFPHIAHTMYNVQMEFTEVL